jgi:peptidoglycan/xylan/chitin deacetylase (PgdA/CDA1 family)
MRDELVIARFVDNALTHKPIVVHGDGSQYRNYIYVEDLAEAHVLALGPEGANGTFNLEGDQQVTVRELVDAVVAVVPDHVDYEFGAARPGDYEGRAVSAAHAETILGWRPHVRFSDGLRRYVDWYQRRNEDRAGTAARARSTKVSVAPLLWTVPLVLAVLALPMLAVHGHTALSFAWRSLAVVLAAGATWLTARWMPRAAPRLAAVVLCFTSLWLLSQASTPLVPVVALVFGVGVGLLVKDRPVSTPVPILGMAAVAAAIVALGATVSGLLAWWAGAALIADSCRGLVADVIREPRRRVGFLLDAAAVVVAGALTAVVGGTSVNAGWFSQPVQHGSRARGEVALTLDVVNPGTATVVADALAHEHVQGTFFVSGKGVRANPSAARAILDRAQLLGNGTYDGTRLGVFDPRVAQHVVAESTFRQATQVCPAFIRPPAGYHTPLLAWSARHRGIAVVGSDVVVSTREADDPTEMTQHVLDAVRAGSIVTIDISHGGAAAAQLAAASMPAIVQGLRSRNLTPVPLDTLLGRPSYVAHC